MDKISLLDRQLKKWAEQKQPTLRDTAELAKKIQANLRQQGLLARIPDTAPTQPWYCEIVKALLWAAVGAAVGAAVAFLFIQLPLSAHRSIDVHPESVSPCTVGQQKIIMKSKILREKTVLFTQVNALFEKKLRWLAETNNEITLGVNEKNFVPPDLNAKPLVLVKVKLISRKVGTHDWQNEWNASIITRSEEVVCLKSTKKHGNSLKIWTLPVEKNMIMVESGFNFNSPLTLASFAESIFNAGKTQRILTVNNEEIEYRVLQTATLLPSTKRTGTNRNG